MKFLVVNKFFYMTDKFSPTKKERKCYVTKTEITVLITTLTQCTNGFENRDNIDFTS